MDRSFEYKIQLSVGANDFSPDIEKILKNAQIKADKNAIRVTITGNQEDFIKQLLDLKKQMPNLDLTDGIEIHLADELLEQTDAGKKALSDLATVLANSLQEMSADIKNVDEMIGNVQKKISDLEKRKLQLFNNKDIKDASSAFDAAEKRFQEASTKFNNTTGKVQQRNLDNMRNAYQDMVNFEKEAGKSASAVLNRTQQNMGKNVEKEILQGYQSLNDIKPTGTYAEAVKTINEQLLEQQSILQNLNAQRDQLLNPTVDVKGKLVDTFKQDIQSQIDELGEFKIKVKPVVSEDLKGAKIEIVENDIDSNNKPETFTQQDSEDATRNWITELEEIEAKAGETKTAIKNIWDFNKADSSIDLWGSELEKAGLSYNPSQITSGEDKIQEELQETAEKAKEATEAINEEKQAEGQLITVYRAYNRTAGVVGDKGMTWFSDDIDTMKTYIAQNPSRNVIKKEIDTSKLFKMDAQGAEAGVITYLGDQSDETSKKITEVYDKIQILKKELAEKPSDELSKELENLEREYRDLSDDESNMYGTHSTEWFADRIKERGYKGVEFNNVIDDYYMKSGKTTTTIVLFDNEALKKTEDITTQIKGNIEKTQEVFDRQSAINTHADYLLSIPGIDETCDDIDILKIGLEDLEDKERLVSMSTKDLSEYLREITVTITEDNGLESGDLYGMFNDEIVHLFDKDTAIGKYYDYLVQNTDFGETEEEVSAAYEQIAQKILDFQKEVTDTMRKKLQFMINKVELQSDEEEIHEESSEASETVTADIEKETTARQNNATAAEEEAVKVEQSNEAKKRSYAEFEKILKDNDAVYPILPTSELTSQFEKYFSEIQRQFVDGLVPDDKVLEKLDNKYSELLDSWTNRSKGKNKGSLEIDTTTSQVEDLGQEFQETAQEAGDAAQDVEKRIQEVCQSIINHIQEAYDVAAEEYLKHEYLWSWSDMSDTTAAEALPNVFTQTGYGFDLDPNDFQNGKWIREGKIPDNTKEELRRFRSHVEGLLSIKKDVNSDADALKRYMDAQDELYSMFNDYTLDDLLPKSLLDRVKSRIKQREKTLPDIHTLESQYMANYGFLDSFISEAFPQNEIANMILEQLKGSIPENLLPYFKEAILNEIGRQMPSDNDGKIDIKSVVSSIQELWRDTQNVNPEVVGKRFDALIDHFRIPDDLKSDYDDFYKRVTLGILPAEVAAKRFNNQLRSFYEEDFRVKTNDLTNGYVNGSYGSGIGDKTFSQSGDIYKVMQKNVKNGLMDSKQAVGEYFNEILKLAKDNGDKISKELIEKLNPYESYIDKDLINYFNSLNNMGNTSATTTSQLEKETEVKRDNTAATNELIEAEKKLREEASKPIVNTTGAESPTTPLPPQVEEALVDDEAKVDEVVEAEKKKFGELGTELSTDIPQAIDKKNEALDGEVTKVNEVVDAEIAKFGALETELSEAIPQAINTKNEALDSEKNKVDTIVQAEIDKFGQLETKIKTDIPKAIEEKNKALDTEKTKVDEVVKDEIEKFSELNNIINGVKTSVDAKNKSVDEAKDKDWKKNDTKSGEGSDDGGSDEAPERTFVENDTLTGYAKKASTMLKNYPVTLSAELDKAALKAEVKKVAPELAEDFNKQFGTSITSKDIEKAFDSLIKKEEAERKALAKQEEATKKTLADIDEEFQKAQAEGMRKEQEAKEKANLKARMDENKAYNDMLAERDKLEEEFAKDQENRQKKALAFIKENEEYEKNKTQEEYANKYLEERNNLYDKIIERLKVYENMRKRIAKGDMKAGDSEINAQMLMAEIEGYMDQYEHNPHFNAPKSKVDYVVNKFDSIDKEAEELDILRRSEEEYKKLTKLVNEYANAKMRIAVGKAREGDVGIVNNRKFEDRIKELQQQEIYSQKREKAATERLRDLDKEIEEAQNKSAARKEDPAIKARENAIKNYIKKLKELAKWEEQVKDLRNRGVSDDDSRITSRDRNIQAIKKQISVMENLNLTEEENLNIQTQVDEARRKYSVDIKEANDKKDSASGQQSLNVTKQKYIKLLKEENDLLMKNYQLEKAGKTDSVEYVDNEKDIKRIQREREEIQETLKTEQQAEFVKEEMSKANRSRKEAEAAYDKKLITEEENLQKRRLNLLQQITQWLNANSIADKKYGSLLADGIKTLNSSAEVTPEILKQIETEFKNVKLEATKAGDTGAGFFQILKKRWQSLGAYLGSFVSFYRVIAGIRQAFSTITELDTQLVDLRKTTKMNTDELNEFYFSANQVAKQMGVTTSEIISQAAAWSRLNKIGHLCGNI